LREGLGVRKLVVEKEGEEDEDDEDEVLDFLGA